MAEYAPKHITTAPEPAPNLYQAYGEAMQHAINEHAQNLTDSYVAAARIGSVAGHELDTEYVRGLSEERHYTGRDADIAFAREQVRSLQKGINSGWMTAEQIKQARAEMAEWRALQGADTKYKQQRSAENAQDVHDLIYAEAHAKTTERLNDIDDFWGIKIEQPKEPANERKAPARASRKRNGQASKEANAQAPAEGSEAKEGTTAQPKKVRAQAAPKEASQPRAVKARRSPAKAAAVAAIESIEPVAPAERTRVAAEPVAPVVSAEIKTGTERSDSTPNENETESDKISKLHFEGDPTKLVGQEWVDEFGYLNRVVGIDSDSHLSVQRLQRRDGRKWDDPDAPNSRYAKKPRLQTTYNAHITDVFRDLEGYKTLGEPGTRAHASMYEQAEAKTEGENGAEAAQKNRIRRLGSAIVRPLAKLQTAPPRMPLENYVGKEFSHGERQYRVIGFDPTRKYVQFRQLEGGDLVGEPLDSPAARIDRALPKNRRTKQATRPSNSLKR